MMMLFGSCPRCQTVIPDDRLRDQPIVCPSCGFTDNKMYDIVESKLESRFIYTAIFVAVVLIAGFIQAASWDKYALEIIPLKAKQAIGISSPEDLTRISTICRDRLKFDCLEEALAQKARFDKEALSELGQVQFQRKEYLASADTLKTYFAMNGSDLEATYYYAKALSRTGQPEQAAEYFAKVLAAKPETLQITVTQNYVKMLMENGRNLQALALIEGIRKSSPTAALFMDKEVKQLARYVSAK